jgi:hypothetical protein
VRRSHAALVLLVSALSFCGPALMRPACTSLTRMSAKAVRNAACQHSSHDEGSRAQRHFRDRQWLVRGAPSGELLLEMRRAAQELTGETDWSPCGQ